MQERCSMSLTCKVRMVYNILHMRPRTLILASLIVIVALLIVGFLCYRSTKIPLPTNLIRQMHLLLSDPKPQVNSDNLSVSTSLLVLQNTAFVLQFAAWIFSILAIIVAIVGIAGGKELLNIRRAERKMKEAFGSLEEEHKKFKEMREIEFNFTRARIFYTQEHYDDAWEILASLPDSHSFEVSMYRGMTLLKRGDITDAIDAFESALNFPDAEKHRAYVNLGQCWFSIKEYDLAIDYYDKAIAKKSTLADAYIGKARALRKKGKIDKAIETLNIVLNLDKQNAKAYYNRSCYYLLLGKGNEEVSLRDLEQAIKYNPDRYLKLAKEDSDLDSLKNSERFSERFKGLIKVKE